MIIFLGFESKYISLEISLATPYHVLIMLYFVRAIAFDISGIMCMACKTCITPFPTVLTLWYTRVHVCALNCHNMITNVKAPTDEIFSLEATLCILYVNPNYCHTWFRGSFDDAWSRGKDDIVKMWMNCRTFLTTSKIMGIFVSSIK